MYARLIESSGHRPLLLFEDGSTGIPVNLGLFSRRQFLDLLGRRFEVGTRLSAQHYTVRLPERAGHPH